MRPIGWRYESRRHSLAAQGIRTGRKYDAKLSTMSPRTALEYFMLPSEEFARREAERTAEEYTRPPEEDTESGVKVFAARKRYDAKSVWMGGVPEKDDFGEKIIDEFIDGKTRMGPWAMMTPDTWNRMGVGKFGTGFGQKYKKVGDDWVKVEG